MGDHNQVMVVQHQISSETSKKRSILRQLMLYPSSIAKFVRSILMHQVHLLFITANISTKNFKVSSFLITWRIQSAISARRCFLIRKQCFVTWESNTSSLTKS